MLGLLMGVIVYRLFAQKRSGESGPLSFEKGSWSPPRCTAWATAATTRRRPWASSPAFLFSAGLLGATFHIPLWIVLSCHAAIALGTMLGGWRVVKTMGQKVTKLKPVDGFCAEAAAATTLFTASAFGIPVSTTHTITGAHHGHRLAQAVERGALGRGRAHHLGVGPDRSVRGGSLRAGLLPGSTGAGLRPGAPRSQFDAYRGHAARKTEEVPGNQSAPEGFRPVLGGRAGRDARGGPESGPGAGGVPGAVRRVLRPDFHRRPRRAHLCQVPASAPGAGAASGGAALPRLLRPQRGLDAEAGLRGGGFFRGGARLPRPGRPLGRPRHGQRDDAPRAHHPRPGRLAGEPAVPRASSSTRPSWRGSSWACRRWTRRASAQPAARRAAG